MRAAQLCLGNICEKFASTGAKCLFSPFLKLPEFIYYDLNLNNVEIFPSKAFSNIHISSFFIRDSTLVSVPSDAFEGIRQINYLEFQNVKNIELLLSGNNSFFLFDKVLSLKINKNSNINSQNFDFYLKIINSLNVKQVTMQHLDIQNLTFNFSNYNFEVFDLTANQIGSINVILNEKIKELHFDRNDIEIINFDSKESKLLYLNLNNNLIGHFTSPKLSTLSSLILGSNKLSHITNRTFLNMTSLQTINLNRNKINYIESDSFKNLINLKILFLNFNLLSEANPKLFFTSIDCIYLSQNNFKLFSYENFFSIQNTSLKKLDLSLNSIRTIYINLTEIDFLDLSENYFIQVQNFCVNKINNLILEKNLYEKLDLIFLKNADFILNLKLGSNKFHDLFENDLKNFQNLASLDLRENLIEIIEFPELILLKELRLNSNRIGKIYQKTFGKLKNLQVLILSYNKIDFIEEKSFINLTNLKVLNLNKNYLVQMVDFSYFFSIEQVTFNFQNAKLKINNFNFSNLIYDNNKKIRIEFVGNKLIDIPSHLFCSKNINYLKNGLIYVENVNDFDKCLFTQIKGLNVTIKSRKKSECELKNFAKINEIIIDDDDYDEDLKCVNNTEILNCSDFFDLKYECKYDVENMNRSTIWMINSYFRSFRCESINHYYLASNYTICLMNEYFKISCFVEENKLMITFEPNDMDNFNKNFHLFSFSDQITGIFHHKTRSLIFVIESNGIYDIVVSASDFFLVRNTGILINGCQNEKINKDPSKIINEKNSTKNLMKFIDEYQNLINSKNFSLPIFSKYFNTLIRVSKPNKTKNKSIEFNCKSIFLFVFLRLFFFFGNFL